MHIIPLIYFTERLEVVIEYLNHRLLRSTDRKGAEKKRQIVAKISAQTALMNNN